MASCPTERGSAGREQIAWELVPSKPGARLLSPGYRLLAHIGGLEFTGHSPDDLEPVLPDRARAAGFRLDESVNGPATLTDCILSGDLPCHIEVDGVPLQRAITFRIDLTPLARPADLTPNNLRLKVRPTDDAVEVLDEWFEEGIQKLEAALPDNVRLRCCLTCLYSDYSPYGHGLLGMQCHRRAKEQYLSVRTKRDYFKVPVTEDVPETHVCDEYERRRPGTGYRG